MRDSVVAPFVPTLVVIVTLPSTPVVNPKSNRKPITPPYHGWTEYFRSRVQTADADFPEEDKYSE